MKKNKTPHDSSKISLINMVAVSFLALVFAAASIANVWILNNNVNLIYQAPYSVIRSVNNITNIISEMEVRITRMADYEHEEEFELVKQEFDYQKQQLENALKYIGEKYLGDKNDIVRLNEKVDLILKNESLIFEKLGSYTPEGLKNEINSNLSPYYEDAFAICDKIASTTERKVEQISGDSSMTAATNTVFAVVLAAAMVIVTVYLQIVVKKKNRELEYHEHLFSLITKNVDDVTLIYDPEQSGLEFVSENAGRILGFPADTVKEQFKELFPGLYSICSGATVEAALTDEPEFRFISCSENHERWIRPRIYPIKASKSSRKLIITLSDLTKERTARLALQDALLTAQKANDAKKDFLSRMSHEIRTPLNAVTGMVMIAQSVPDNPVRTQDCLTKIQYSAKHLLGIINEVLDMSAIENGKLQIAKEPFRLKELLLSVASVYYDQCHQNGKHFKIYADHIKTGTVVGDQFRLNQVLLNLLSNAVKFTPEGGTIALTVKELTSNHGRVYFRFSVKDDGIGMDEDALLRIFSPFEQETASTAKKYGGSGLGLAITKNLTDLMGGTISVTSRKGEGSEFRVELPFGCTEQDCVPNIKTFRGLRVLLVDDDPVSRRLTLESLRSLSVQVFPACGVPEAVSLLDTAEQNDSGFDYCIFMCEMPRPGDLEFLKRVSASGYSKKRTQTAVFAYSFAGDVETLKETGVSYFSLRPALSCELCLLFSGSSDLQPVQLSAVANRKADFSAYRVLLAEDNELNLEIAVDLLSHTGVKIDAVTNGREALDRFLPSSAGTYDAVLLDIQMPELDGYETAKQIRASNHPDARAVPIIAMTANAFSEDVVAALSCGMDGHISKPIEPDVLYKTLGAFLTENPPKLK